MFQFPRLPPRTVWILVRVAGHDPCWVPPFGNPRIEGRLRLPGAYRSLPRPSSASHAKASAVRPRYLLPAVPINNVNSYYWITDVTNQQYAVPNYLTGRLINAKVTFEF